MATSPSNEPLESITEEPANFTEKDFSGDFSNGKKFKKFTVKNA